MPTVGEHSGKISGQPISGERHETSASSISASNLAAGAATLCTVSSVAWAQTHLTRPITMIFPFTAGGATDIIARIVAEPMSRTLGQPVIIENIGGAGGTTGS